MLQLFNMHNPFLVVLALWLAHYLCDYPLQGPFLSQAKNRNTAVPGFPWYQAMSAHCGIHAGAVWLLTGQWYLGLFEFIAHYFIDCLKCSGAIDVDEDQILHFMCKVVWVSILWFIP